MILHVLAKVTIEKRNNQENKFLHCDWCKCQCLSVADPGFPVGGGVDLVGGPWTPEVAMFQKFCMSKRKNLDP